MKYLEFFVLFLYLSACSAIPEARETDETADIFPDYAGVTIPPNIAPLNFSLNDYSGEAFALLESSGYRTRVKTTGGNFRIPSSEWKKLISASEDNRINVTLIINRDGWMKLKPFSIHISSDSIDPYIAYRLIEPGYMIWNEMGIYQRQLATFSETAIIENTMTDHSCINCHSFRMQSPDNMLFHLREKNPGTYIVMNGKIEKLNTKTDRTISALVYPSWHPSGKYVAFSVNNTKQAFHRNDPNRIEVFDEASDVVVYDVNRHEIVTTPLLFSTASFETFPTFSPDGKRLFFCSAKAIDIPRNYSEVKYSLCSIAFDPDNRTFGNEVDTLYNTAESGMSASFPRVSPDGRFIMYTLSGYGNFSIWHKDADLRMLSLETGENYSLDILNSNDVESYHSWSSNSRWIIFSSRRVDGLYTRPYMAHIDENGVATKPFVLPQKDAAFYHRFMKSYNIPEFITDKVNLSAFDLADIAKHDQGTNVTFVEGMKK
jgi:hypothetical protein